jgi:sugar/nucleoside kinase (ribokinase family)
VIGDACLDLAFPVGWENSADPGSTLASFMPGGTGLNVAIGLARLGGNATFFGGIGKDALGLFVRDFLRGEGVQIAGTYRSAARTRVVCVFVRPDGEREFLGIPALAADDRVPTVRNFGETFGDVEVVFATGAVLRRPSGRRPVLQALADFRRAGIPTILDLNIREHRLSDWARYREALLAACLLATIVLGTEVEFRAVNGGPPRLREISQTHIVKLGKEGCRIRRRCETTAVRGFAVQCVDSTGAGDAFAAAFLRAYYRDVSLCEACAFGNAAGALACTAAGSSRALPSLSDIARFVS